MLVLSSVIFISGAACTVAVASTHAHRLCVCSSKCERARPTRQPSMSLRKASSAALSKPRPQPASPLYGPLTKCGFRAQTSHPTRLLTTPHTKGPTQPQRTERLLPRLASRAAGRRH